MSALEDQRQSHGGREARSGLISSLIVVALSLCVVRSVSACRQSVCLSLSLSLFLLVSVCT